MTTNQTLISKLNQLWCKCCAGHHKSYDVNHSIEQKYSCGDLTYNVWHSGYIGDDINGSFSTLEAAEQFLIEGLKVQIQEQCKTEKFNQENNFESDFDYAAVLKELSELKIEPPQYENFEEKYLNLLAKYNGLKYDYDNSTYFLDSLKVPTEGEDIPELKYSLCYRIELALNQLK